VKIVVNKPRSQ